MAASKGFTVGRNVSVSIDGSKLSITVDLSVDGTPSTSGKSMTLATTGAPQVIGSLADGRPVKANLSVFVPMAD